MRPFAFQPLSCVRGEVYLLGDKSIAHRALIISSLSRGKTKIENFPANKDCLATLNAFRKLGIKITQTFSDPHSKFSSTVTVFGRGLHGLKRPSGPIFVGESGTTLRMLLGVLAGQDFNTKLIAGGSLSKRPMLRVSLPLRLMGAQIETRSVIRNGQYEEYPPIIIKGVSLKPIFYNMPVASAQVKSAILLAALYTSGETRIVEPIKTRDHTERLLRLFQARIKLYKNNIVIKGGTDLFTPGSLSVPADISSASFFMVLATIIPDSEVLIRNVCLNPSRAGIINVLKRMGADIRFLKVRRQAITMCEPVGDLLVKSSFLKGTIVRKEEVPSLIDELPILMAAACYAKTKSVFEGVNELRVKEADRVTSMTKNLRRMGAVISISKSINGEEKIIIKGVNTLTGAKIRSFRDHRTAMSMIVAGLSAKGASSIDDVSCIDKSFPDFLRILHTLKR